MKIATITFLLFFTAFNVSAQVTKTEDEVFSYVEKMPEFPGGDSALHAFIKENLVFPESCRMGATTNVVVQFVVDVNGLVTDPKIVWGGHACGLNQEALRLVALLSDPKMAWSPGIHQGRKVPVKFTLPIKFVPGKGESERVRE